MVNSFPEVEARADGAIPGPSSSTSPRTAMPQGTPSPAPRSSCRSRRGQWEHTRSQPTAPACFPASLPSAERPATRDEGGGEAPRDGAARCL
ncbi:hypothetical protein ZWY2020_020867 [Hordeum vulgare]|nr:hypothetical protein ZWY2020_020867 [Hordeum vulgare]